MSGERPKIEKKTVKVETVLNAPQWKALQLIKPNTITALVFGRGVGKSFLHRQIWYQEVVRAISQRKAVSIALMCPTLKQASDVYGQLMINELYTKYKFLDGEVKKNIWRVRFPWGSQIQFFGAENPDAARGIRADVVSIDEADDIEPGIFDAICLPWASHVQSKKMIILTGTPRRGRYGLLYKYYERGQALNEDGTKMYPHINSLRATYQDAPKEVSAEYVERLRQTMVPEVFAREWLANFDSGDGLVYPFSDEIHVKRPDKEQVYSDILIGVDFGYEDPGVFLAVGVIGSGRDAKIHVLEECVETRQTQSWWIAKAREWNKKYPDARWFADPSQPAFIQALKSEAGVGIKQAENRREEGVQAVADKLVERTKADGTRYTNFAVSPACRVTIRELATYRRRRDRRDPDKILESIQDGDDHTMDALRYAVFSHFGKPLAVRQLSDDKDNIW